MIRAIAITTAGVLSLIFGLAGVAEGAGSTPTDGAFARPVDGASISQGFGCTDLEFEPVDRHCPGGHWHSGVDLAAAAGTPVHATASGQALVLISPGGYGIHVIIDHGNGLTSLYGHLSSVNVHSGEDVAGGDVIGGVGSTGNSTGPHLHFEIRRDGIAEDPRGDLALP